MSDNDKEISIETVKTNVLGPEMEVTRTANNLTLEQLALKIDELTNKLAENVAPTKTVEPSPFQFDEKDIPERIRKIKSEWGFK